MKCVGKISRIARQLSLFECVLKQKWTEKHAANLCFVSCEEHLRIEKLHTFFFGLGGIFVNKNISKNRRGKRWLKYPQLPIWLKYPQLPHLTEISPLACFRRPFTHSYSKLVVIVGQKKWGEVISHWYKDRRGNPTLSPPQTPGTSRPGSQRFLRTPGAGRLGRNIKRCLNAECMAFKTEKNLKFEQNNKVF